MKRREFFQQAAFAGVAIATERVALAAREVMLYLDPVKGADANEGTKASPLKTLPAAAARVNKLQEPGAVTLVLEEGIYGVNETAMFQPARPFTKTERLTIRAAVLPDDPDWNPARMPTLIHTMALSADWNGRPDPFGGVAYGMQIETSHATVQGLRIFGMPAVEKPKAGAIHRLYAIGRIDRSLDDLEVKQCLFAGDEVTNPHHLSLLVNGSGLVVDHCVFYRVKQTVVYWSPGTKGHAMRNCVIYGCRAGVWTSGIANDFDYRNNVVANGEFVWIGQGAQSVRTRRRWAANGRATPGWYASGRTRPWRAASGTCAARGALHREGKLFRREPEIHRVRRRAGSKFPRQRPVLSGTDRHEEDRSADRTGDGRIEEKLSAPGRRGCRQYRGRALHEAGMSVRKGHIVI
jgi:hypothetical protein